MDASTSLRNDNRVGLYDDEVFLSVGENKQESDFDLKYQRRVKNTCYYLPRRERLN